MSYEPQFSDRFIVGPWRPAYAGREGFGAELRQPPDPLTFDLLTGTR